MDTLIIGCGYLGARVANLFQERGAKVAVTTRRSEAAETFRRQGLMPIVCDVLRPESLTTLPRVHTVVHAVGLDRTSGASMREVYVDGLRNVLEHLPRPQRLVLVSSSSVYGQKNGEWLDEEAITEPEEPSGQVVLEAERTLRERYADAIILRFAGIYGPGRLLRRQTIEANEPIVGDAEKWLNLIHVADGARSVLAAADRGEPGRVVNVCDDEPMRRRDFYRILASLLDAPEPTFVLPADGVTPPHERANRRLRNRRLHDELQVDLRYPNARLGLAAAVREEGRRS